MPRPSTAFDSVAGVPLHYDRLPGQYGTRGEPREFFARPVAIDGRWGPETGGGVATALDELDLGEVENPSDAGAVADVLADVWLDFLAAAAEAGCEEVAAEPTPAELLRAAHAVLDRELPDAPQRKKIEAALAAFAEHPDVAALLEGG